MTMYRELTANELADLVLEGVDDSPVIRSMFAEVMDATVDAVRVRPRGEETGDKAVTLISGKVAVTDIVLCLYIPGDGLWVAFGK